MSWLDDESLTVVVAGPPEREGVTVVAGIVAQAGSEVIDWTLDLGSVPAGVSSAFDLDGFEVASVLLFADWGAQIDVHLTFLDAATGAVVGVASPSSRMIWVEADGTVTVAPGADVVAPTEAGEELIEADLPADPLFEGVSE